MAFIFIRHFIRHCRRLHTIDIFGFDATAPLPRKEIIIFSSSSLAISFAATSFLSARYFSFDTLLLLIDMMIIYVIIFFRYFHMLRYIFAAMPMILHIDVITTIDTFFTYFRHYYYFRLRWYFLFIFDITIWCAALLYCLLLAFFIIYYFSRWFSFFSSIRWYDIIFRHYFHFLHCWLYWLLMFHDIIFFDYFIIAFHFLSLRLRLLLPLSEFIFAFDYFQYIDDIDIVSIFSSLWLRFRFLRHYAFHADYEYCFRYYHRCHYWYEFTFFHLIFSPLLPYYADVERHIDTRHLGHYYDIRHWILLSLSRYWLFLRDYFRHFDTRTFSSPWRFLRFRHSLLAFAMLCFRHIISFIDISWILYYAFMPLHYTLRHCWCFHSLMLRWCYAARRCLRWLSLRPYYMPLLSFSSLFFDFRHMRSRRHMLLIFFGHYITMLSPDYSYWDDISAFRLSSFHID